MISAATLEVEGGVGRCLRVYSTAASTSAWVRVRGRSSVWNATTAASTVATAEADAAQRCRLIQARAAFTRLGARDRFGGSGAGASGTGCRGAAPGPRGGFDQAEPL